MQERAERRGRPITSNNDADVRNLQQELMDKNKVCFTIVTFKILKINLSIKFGLAGNFRASTFA